MRKRCRPVFTLGVLRGEGIGPDVIRAALRVLDALGTTGCSKFEISFGGPIGVEAKSRCGESLSDEVVEFCRNIFSRGGAILAGPGGDRFVYDLRKRFDLFCKLSPLKVASELIHAARIKPQYLQNVDILLIRENVSGIYQGQWNETSTPHEGRKAEHSCFYTENQVRRILQIAARVASRRRGEMVVIVKEGGIPAISKLWRDCAFEVAAQAGVKHSLLNVDHAADFVAQ